MKGAGAFPFDPERLSALGRLAAITNGQHAPPPISVPVLVDESGWVTLPVPEYPPREGEIQCVYCQLHTGLTLQWAPIAELDGLLVEFRGGPPDGETDRDAVAAFLTRTGLRSLIADLRAIDAALEGASRLGGETDVR